MLNRSGERRYPCLAPHLGGKALSFTIKYDVSCRFFTDALYQVEEFPSLLRVFNLEWMLYFCQNCFLYLLR